MGQRDLQWAAHQRASYSPELPEAQDGRVYLALSPEGKHRRPDPG